MLTNIVAGVSLHGLCSSHLLVAIWPWAQMLFKSFSLNSSSRASKSALLVTLTLYKNGTLPGSRMGRG